MKTGGLNRALRYFIRQAEVYMVYVAAGSIVMSVYIWLINGYGVSLKEMLGAVPGAVIFISMIVLVSSSMSSAQYWYSVPVSFGCRRWNAFLGTLVMDLLVIAESLVFYMTAAGILQLDNYSASIAAILTVYLIMEGISKLFGIAAVKWGKGSYVVMLAVTVAVSIICGFLIGYSGMKGEAVPLASISAIYQESMWKWAGFLAGAVISVAGNVAGYGILRKFEVKA